MRLVSIFGGIAAFLLLLSIVQTVGAQDWRTEAEKRIEGHRKADFIFKILDAHGSPVEGATVNIEMQRHAFKFGTAVESAWVREEPRADLSSGDLDLGEKLSAFRVQLDVEKGTAIQSAFLQFTADKDRQDQATALTIWATIEGNAPDFDRYGISSRTRSRASVSWTVEPWLVQEERGGAQRSPDVAALVQEVVDQEAWAPGHHIVFVIDGSGKRSARTFDESPQAAPGLAVVIAGEEKTTQVMGPHDDAEEAGADFFSDDASRYRSETVNLFNYATLQNALKWRPWERDRGVADGALTWLSSQDIPVRGHAMIWSSWRWNAIPEDVEERQNDQEFVRRRAADHVQAIASAYAGQVPEWDVINEPLHETDLENIIGFEERLNWFQLAHAADPDPRLFVNDFDILEGPARVDDYKQLITDLIDAGAEVEGIGLQGHFLGQPPSPEQLVDRLASLAELGLPLQITEFDMNKNWSEQQQADFMADVLTAAFAEPAVTAFNMWGFWDGNHWLGNAPLFTTDWTLKPSGAVWKDLIFNRWWTVAEGTTDAEGSLTLRGFKGDYLLSVNYRGHLDTLRAELPFQHTVEWTLPNVSVSSENEDPLKDRLDAIVYPNPLSDTAYLELEAPAASEIHISVFDMLGRVVWRREWTHFSPHRGRIELATDTWAAGVYMVRVFSTDRSHEAVKTVPITILKR